MFELGDEQADSSGWEGNVTVHEKERRRPQKQTGNRRKDGQ